MLNENQIEKYLYKYVRRQDEFILFVLSTTAARVFANNKIQSFDKMFTMKEAFKVSHDMTLINRAKATMIQEQISSLGEDLHAIALATYADTSSLYTVQPVFRTNTELVNEINNLIDESKEKLRKIISKPVFILNNKKYAPDEAYRLITQDALLNKQVVGEKTAIRNALNRLYDAPIKFVTNNASDDSEDVTSATNTLRMSVLSFIKDVFKKVSDIVKKQVKCDGIELSAHVCPAPDHAPAQGHQFSNEEFEKMQSGQDFVDVNGNHYEGFVRQIGQWNCRHYVKPIKIGKSVPEHSQTELDTILADNQRGYTTKDGRHYTLYECTQVQRGYERKIRENKEKYVLANIVEDKVKMQQYKGKVTTLTREYRAFSTACGLPYKAERIKVKDY